MADQKPASLEAGPSTASSVPSSSTASPGSPSATRVPLTLDMRPMSPDPIVIDVSVHQKGEASGTAEGMLINVEREGEMSRLLTVYVDRTEEKALPYRGGYRDVRYGTRYLNATAQTSIPWPPRPPKVWPLMITRETQKSEMKNQNKQTIREGFTHMDKNETFVALDMNGVVIDNSFGYYRIPGPYKDSDQWAEERRRAAIVIQRYTRREIAQRTAERIRQYAREKKEFWTEQDRKKKEEADKTLRWEIERRINPRTGADFEILYQELEHWRLQELKKITSSGAVGPDRRSVVKELLMKELRLLQAIDKLRSKAAKENRKDRIGKSMVRMGAPKIWEMTNGHIVHVRTPATARASDLDHLYKALAEEVESMDERMGVLGYVKWTVQVFNSPLTREILLLIEREADLMYRGRPAKSLLGLRQRILNFSFSLWSVLIITLRPSPSSMCPPTSTLARTALQCEGTLRQNSPDHCQAS